MFEYGLDLSQMSGFIISLCMVTIGTAFFIGFTVKKLLQFMKSF